MSNPVLGGKTKITINDIYEIGKANPSIHLCLELYHRKKFDNEFEMLQWMVMLLHENQKKSDELIYELFLLHPDLIGVARRMNEEIKFLRSQLDRTMMEKEISK